MDIAALKKQAFEEARKSPLLGIEDRVKAAMVALGGVGIVALTQSFGWPVLLVALPVAAVAARWFLFGRPETTFHALVRARLKELVEEEKRREAEDASAAEVWRPAGHEADKAVPPPETEAQRSGATTWDVAGRATMPPGGGEPFNRFWPVDAPDADTGPPVPTGPDASAGSSWLGLGPVVIEKPATLAWMNRESPSFAVVLDASDHFMAYRRNGEWVSGSFKLGQLARDFTPLPADDVPALVEAARRALGTFPAAAQGARAEDRPASVDPLPYIVMVDDHFHYQDEEERYEHGRFATYDEAVAACRRMLDGDLRHMFRPGMTADDLYRHYMLFGVDPFVKTVGGERMEPFLSASRYAKEQCGIFAAGA